MPQFDLTPHCKAQLKKLIDGLSDEERRIMTAELPRCACE